MNKPYMIEAIFWSQTDYAAEREGELIRAAYAALQEAGMTSIKPASKADAEAIKTAEEGVAVELIHPQYKSENGFENSTISLASGFETSNGRHLLHMGIHLEDRANPAKAGWAVGLSLAPVIAKSFKVEIAFMSGSPADDDRQPYPSETSLRKSEIPALTAWTYIGPARLDNRKLEILSALRAPGCEKLGDGWQVQLVENLFDEPDSRLLDQLSELEPKGLDYFRPLK